MAWRCGAVLVAVMTAGFVGCGGDDDRGTLDRPPVPMCGERPDDGDMRCDMPLDEALRACVEAFPENDRSCVTKACIVDAMECYRQALDAARACAACWGCSQSVRDHACETSCFNQGRACAEMAADSAEARACVAMARECNVSTCDVPEDAGGGVWLVGCR